MNEATDVREPDPVFVDPTGRRGRIMRRVGIALAGLIAGYLVLVGVGLATGARVPLTPWPNARPSTSGHGPAEEVLMPRNGAHGPVPTKSSVAYRSSSRPNPAAGPSHQPKTRATPTGTKPTGTSTAPAVVTTPSSSSATPRSHGKGNGLTRSPNPRHP